MESPIASFKRKCGNRIKQLLEVGPTSRPATPSSSIVSDTASPPPVNRIASESCLPESPSSNSSRPAFLRASSAPTTSITSKPASTSPSSLGPGPVPVDTTDAVFARDFATTPISNLRERQHRSKPATAPAPLLVSERRPTIVCTLGPTELRSVLPRRPSNMVVRPHSRKSSAATTHSTPAKVDPSLDSTPSLTESTSTASSSSANSSELQSVVEPPSPTSAKVGRSPSTSPLCQSPIKPKAPVLVQKPTFSPLPSPLLSPTSSDYIGSAPKSPSLAFFLRGIRAQPRLSITSLSGPRSAGSQASPTSSIRSREPDSPIFGLARITALKIAQARTLRRAERTPVVEKQPIKLDLSAATRKPYYYRVSNAATAVAGPSSSLTSAKTEPISASITDGDQVASEKLDQVEDETVEGF